MRKLIAAMATLICAGTALAAGVPFTCVQGAYISPGKTPCIAFTYTNPNVNPNLVSFLIVNDLSKDRTIQVVSNQCINVYSNKYTGDACMAGSTRTRYCMSASPAFRKDIKANASKLPVKPSTGITTTTTVSTCSNGKFSQ